MKVLIFGPSGAGKTYVSHALNQQGINAFDTDEIEGLSGWYDRFGTRVAQPETAEEALSKGYSFLWSKKALRHFLSNFEDVYLFGGSGNLFNCLDCFDKVLFLSVDPGLQLERLKSPDRPTPRLDSDANGAVIWGDWLQNEAIQRNIPFIDADRSPEEIYEQIKKHL